MNVGFEGIGRMVATFTCKTGEDAPAVGDIVTLSGSGEVKKSAAGEDFAGMCVSRSGAYAGVQIRGAVTLPYTGSTAPTVGYNGFAAGGSGAVQISAGGIKRLTMAADTAKKFVTILL